MFFEEAISSTSPASWLCLDGLITWNCTPYEVIGFWSMTSFYTTILMTTIIHAILQQSSSKGNGNGIGNQTAGMIGQDHPGVSTRTTRRGRSSNDNNMNDDLVMLCGLIIYFFGFAAGCLLWVLGGIQSVHPFQNCFIQMLGSVLLISCSCLYIIIHIDLGKSWSPIVEQKDNHELVTTGMYKYARHPMYAMFLWGAVATALATLNWVITWCVFGSVFVTLSRIPAEEKIMIRLFGDQYVEYQQQVSALGPPWNYCCFRSRRIHPRGDGYETVR